MRTIRITVILFLVLAAFACNNQQSKKAKGDASATKKLTSEKSIIKKIDKTDEKPISKRIDKIDEKPVIKNTNKLVQKELKPCENLVADILTTSPRYRQLTKGLNNAVVKNGGLPFGISLEGSPNPRQDKAWSYSKTYDFTVYEMYTDRQLNTARFSFDPSNKQLYEYDAVNDKLKPIEFDRNLLLKFEALCK